MRVKLVLLKQRRPQWLRTLVQLSKTSIRQLVWAILLPIHRIVMGGQFSNGRSAPKRILLMNGGHFGDAVISSGVLPVLRSAFPDVEIGFASASWTQGVLKDHPDIKYIHSIDDWRLIRASKTRRQKWMQFWQSRRQFLKEIRQVQYDWAISLFFRPDFLDVAWMAGIPVRATFGHSYWALVATHIAPTVDYSFLMTEGARHVDLLKLLGIEEKHLRLHQTNLPPSDLKAIKELDSLLHSEEGNRPQYCIVHIGAGVKAREMSKEFWRELAISLSKDNIVVFTGQGDREAANIDSVIDGLSNCVSACSKLSWQGLVAAVRNANNVYSVDTALAHVAAAAGTPLHAVYTGITGVGRWRAEGKDVTIWTQHVSCTPCFKPNGCPEMTCLSGIRPANLLGSYSMDRGEDSVVTISTESSGD